VPVGKRRSRRKLKIGRLDEVSLAQAIAQAEALRPQIKAGADPVAGKFDAKQAITFEELAEQRLTRGDPLRQGSEADYRHLLKRDLLPAIGGVPAAKVTRQQVIAVLESIAGRGSTRRADTARAMISSIYGYGMDRGTVHENPAAGLRNRHDYQPRDVVLSPREIRKLWHAMDNGAAVASPAMATIIRVALLTGQRRAEIAGLRKDELDQSSAHPCLIIARGRAKNRNQHRVPLSPAACRLLGDAVAASGESPFVFPGPNGKPILPRSVSKAMERTRAKLGITDITVHDLRRTVGSMMTKFGVPKDVRERVLNHGGKRKGSITESVYSWYDYDAEKRAALELWADALECIVTGCGAEIEDYNARLARLKGSGTIRIAAA
jgi:integrase